MLRTSRAWRTAVGQADIITLLIGFNDLGDCVQGTSARYDAEIAGVARNIDATLTEVERLQGSHPHAVRVIAYYDVCRGYPAAIALGPEFQQFYGRKLVQLNSAICAAAAQHAAMCTQLLLAFNGPYGHRDASDLLVEDHEHPNRQGHQLIADRIAEAGFSPIDP
jgi:lysophospholipase L1-like esterase